jgi:hypothetical protein
MASPMAIYPEMSPDNGYVTCTVEFAVGATGAVGAITGGRELGTPVRNGVGDYSFPLTNTASRFGGGYAKAIGADSTTAGKESTIIANSVTSTSAPLVRFQFYRKDTGAAAEVANGDSIICVLRLKYKD